jgi:CheY-like chemotaxis protein
MRSRAWSLPYYEVAKRLREDGSSPLIVAMSGYGQEADRRRSREAGIVMHLVKPIDPNEIEAFLAGVGQDPTPSP